MKSHLFKILFILLLIPSICAADDFDLYDKELFASVIVLQIIDGLTTVDLLSKGNYIDKNWNWKYGTRYPSPGHMWGVKAAELIGAYYVGKALPRKHRKVFYLLVDATFIYCIQGNLKIGAGLKFNF